MDRIISQKHLIKVFADGRNDWKHIPQLTFAVAFINFPADWQLYLTFDDSLYTF